MVMKQRQQVSQEAALAVCMPGAGPKVDFGFNSEVCRTLAETRRKGKLCTCVECSRITREKRADLGYFGTDHHRIRLSLYIGLLIVAAQIPSNRRVSRL